jgi:cytochrome P450
MQFGNMMLILFAGHDTTGHTMTWLTYEIAKHPEHQAKLHHEVDAFFDGLKGRDPVYTDCDQLPFLTRCVMETLRMWPAVLNGTFRQLQYPDEVKGPHGQRIMLPKGTYVQIPNWSRHRSTKLWGDDADEFNPMRDFQDEEIWQGGYKGYNPASKRFSPFTFQPRDCLGKNFAQMEMRMILAHLFHKFHFTLSEPYAKWDPATDVPLENNQGTSGPRDLTPEGQFPSLISFFPSFLPSQIPSFLPSLL